MEADLFALLSRGSGVGVWTLVCIAVVTLIRGWPALRKLSLESDGSLRKDLLTRIRDLEHRNKELDKAIASERRDCDRQLDQLRQDFNGLQRQLIAYQVASGRPFPLDTPHADAAAKRLLDRLDLEKFERPLPEGGESEG